MTYYDKQAGTARLKKAVFQEFYHIASTQRCSFDRGLDGSQWYIVHGWVWVSVAKRLPTFVSTFIGLGCRFRLFIK